MQLQNIVSVIALATAVSAQGTIYYRTAWCMTGNFDKLDPATISACSGFTAACPDCVTRLPSTGSQNSAGPYCESPSSKLDSAKFLEACKAKGAQNSSGSSGIPRGA
ncbi:hypothetical protein HYFRA_00001715 [Hymenoscyphus fraxineus]|uniref:Uncharacterized protein n=1 Tax=Hymenoscyphus fraxineus TaxID=746836 RepID=A0A9N9L952_9HELO|nr:hypothetical protein HYFRA_00001715 [Hymenoscyphus fraxineus]